MTGKRQLSQFMQWDKEKKSLQNGHYGLGKREGRDYWEPSIKESKRRVNTMGNKSEKDMIMTSLIGKI